MSSMSVLKTQRRSIVNAGSHIVTGGSQTDTKASWHDLCCNYLSLKTHRQVFICKFYPKE